MSELLLCTELVLLLVREDVVLVRLELPLLLPPEEESFPDEAAVSVTWLLSANA